MTHLNWVIAADDVIAKKAHFSNGMERKKAYFFIGMELKKAYFSFGMEMKKTYFLRGMEMKYGNSKLRIEFHAENSWNIKHR